VLGGRPLLFLDVDGVLNAFRAWELVHRWRGLVPGNVRAPEGYRHAVADGYDLLLRPEHASWLADLDQRAEIVWATMWMDRAPAALAPVLGYGERWPFVDFRAAQGYALGQRTGQGVGSYKFPGVVAWAGDRPLVWIDDDLEPAIYDWAARRDAGGIPTFLVQPSPDEGWTASERDAVLAFLEAAAPPA
jgi:hypothetical protein